MSKTQFEVPLVIEPENELRFIGPFNRPVVTIMTLRNTGNMTLVFKIKTTAPKRYCVRPNIGKIPPYRTTQVEICLQPFAYDQQEKNKHKFMVQSVLAPQDADLTDLNKLWKELEPDQLMDAKLKCVFEMPGTEASAESNNVITSVGSSVAGSNAPNNLSITDTLKSDAPKLEQALNLSDASNAHAESLAAENKEMRDLNSELQKEIIHLKDQITRYRNSPAARNEHFAPVQVEKQIPELYIALVIGIAAAIVGLLLGKFLL